MVISSQLSRSKTLNQKHSGVFSRPSLIKFTKRKKKKKCLGILRAGLGMFVACFVPGLNFIDQTNDQRWPSCHPLSAFYSCVPSFYKVTGIPHTHTRLFYWSKKKIIQSKCWSLMFLIYFLSLGYDIAGAVFVGLIIGIDPQGLLYQRFLPNRLFTETWSYQPLKQGQRNKHTDKYSRARAHTHIQDKLSDSFRLIQLMALVSWGDSKRHMPKDCTMELNLDM